MEKRHIQKGAVDDLVLLESLSEEAIVYNLRNTFAKQRIYTSIGPVLLSINPFQSISGLYAPNLASKYRRKQPGELAPHVFAVAESAWKAMLSTNTNQCILVSGESGAGKTEAAKKVMGYVMMAAAERATAAAPRDLRDRLLQSNPILEAMGNAMTLRNDNSSRFGKYMTLLFDGAGSPSGAHIAHYLLERPRVVSPGPGERGFHIFYQLLAGASSAELQALGLTLPQDYLLLAGGMRALTIGPRGPSDREEFSITRAAMNTMGFSHELQFHLFSVVAAILHLGNIAFAGDTGARAAPDAPPREPWPHACAACAQARLAAAPRSTCAMKGVPIEGLTKALTYRTITPTGGNTMGDAVTSPISASECVETRDALAKALYSRMFDQLVVSLNENFAPPHGGPHRGEAQGGRSIGVLDIYGFEVFQKNSFEQLCINFCNEKLQQYFIQLTLKAEQLEYSAEGISWTEVSYFDNLPVCELIEGKANTRLPSIIAILDEETIFPEASDSSLHLKLQNQLSSHRHFMADAAGFTIRHYAGDVRYSPDGMLEKNKDSLYRDLQYLMGGSTNAYFAALFPAAARRQAFWREATSEGVAKRPPTAAFQFKAQMADLLGTLSLCQPHYIRTIKPNDEKLAGAFDDARVAHQVRYLGLLENVRVRRAGFAYRAEYSHFVSRFKLLCNSTWPLASGDDHNDTYAILGAMGVRQGEFEFGRTKLFIRKPETLIRLEETRESRLQKLLGSTGDLRILFADAATQLPPYEKLAEAAAAEAAAAMGAKVKPVQLPAAQQRVLLITERAVYATATVAGKVRPLRLPLDAVGIMTVEPGGGGLFALHEMPPPTGKGPQVPLVHLFSAAQVEEIASILTGEASAEGRDFKLRHDSGLTGFVKRKSKYEEQHLSFSDIASLMGAGLPPVAPPPRSVIPSAPPRGPPPPSSCGPPRGLPPTAPPPGPSLRAVPPPAFAPSPPPRTSGLAPGPPARASLGPPSGPPPPLSAAPPGMPGPPPGPPPPLPAATLCIAGTLMAWPTSWTATALDDGPTSRASPNEGGLPPGWEMHHDDEGRPFYYDQGTGESTYTRPSPPQVSAPMALPAPIDVPSGGYNQVWAKRNNVEGNWRTGAASEPVEPVKRASLTPPSNNALGGKSAGSNSTTGWKPPSQTASSGGWKPPSQTASSNETGSWKPTSQPVASGKAGWKPPAQCSAGLETTRSKGLAGRHKWVQANFNPTNDFSSYNSQLQAILSDKFIEWCLRHWKPPGQSTSSSGGAKAPVQRIHVPPARREAKAKALYAYSAMEEDELSLQVGDIVTITSRERDPDYPGWWGGKLGVKSGFFPANYVEEL
ncbi:hypothetical protein AB1Y20_011799 [Prymnesium parvum]|uniref:Myosin-1 n=1 Tax=Prymnesium parvum TaxID=97485 RepID=A0AB34II97_PRYPA